MTKTRNQSIGSHLLYDEPLSPSFDLNVFLVATSGVPDPGNVRGGHVHTLGVRR